MRVLLNSAMTLIRFCDLVKRRLLSTLLQPCMSAVVGVSSATKVYH